MTLSQAQGTFAHNYAKLILWVYDQEWSVTGGELYRPEEMAKIYAERGIGIDPSFHTLKLAGDLNLFINGVFQTNRDAYKPLGDYWKSLDPLNRWGGDFMVKNAQGVLEPKPDSDHFEYHFTGEEHVT